MKRSIALALFLLYVVPVIGINISVHYCCGKIASISFGAENANLCACGSKKMKKNCCQNKTFSFQLKCDQQVSTPLSLKITNSKNFQFSVIPDFELNYYPILNVTSTYSLEHPPDKSKLPIYILNKIFRI